MEDINNAKTMSTLLIINAEVVMNDVILSNHTVYCVNGKIKSITPSKETDLMTADETLDAAGFYVAPGYIDLHIHGARGLAAHKSVEEVEGLSRVLPEYGVTGFLPTITPFSSEEKDLAYLRSLTGIVADGTSVLGYFLEGHFLQLTGAIANIPKNRTKKRVNDLIEAAAPYKLVFGISPEVEGIEQLIPEMTKQGFPAFITHTMANATQTKKAIEAGATHATHFYDVFPYPGNKENGVRGCGTVEAIMADPRANVDFILDGEHVEPIAVEMALVCKGRDNVSLITDANVNAGLPAGRYSGLDNTEIIVEYEGGPARIADGPLKGGLTGSGLTMDRAVRNAVALLGLDIPLAVAMGSANPARVLGLQGQKGYIKEGYDADLLLLDKELNVLKCWVGQKCCFTK